MFLVQMLVLFVIYQKQLTKIRPVVSLVCKSSFFFLVSPTDAPPPAIFLTHHGLIVDISFTPTEAQGSLIVVMKRILCKPTFACSCDGIVFILAARCCFVCWFRSIIDKQAIFAFLNILSFSFGNHRQISSPKFTNL